MWTRWGPAGPFLYFQYPSIFESDQIKVKRRGIPSTARNLDRNLQGAREDPVKTTLRRPVPPAPPIAKLAAAAAAIAQGLQGKPQVVRPLPCNH